MKTFALMCATMLMLAATASADDLAVSNSTLGQMGLAGMQSISDDEGATVRGKFTFATVWGGSRANFPGQQQSTDNYAAGAAWFGKGSSAGGYSFSGAAGIGAGLVVDGMGGFALGVVFGAGVSGGIANAWAN